MKKITTLALIAVMALHPVANVTQVYAQEASSSAQVEVTPSPEVSVSPEASVSPEVSASPDVTPSVEPSTQPSATPEVSLTPELTPSPSPKSVEDIEREAYPRIYPITATESGTLKPENTTTLGGGSLPGVPVANPPGGTHYGQLYVSLTESNSVSIRYTTNGTTPTCSSTTYTAPILINVTGTTLKAVGCNALGTGPVMTETYTINSPGYVTTLAEGYLGGMNNFRTNILVHNPQAGGQRVEVMYLVQGGNNLSETYDIVSHGRVTIVPPSTLLNKSFSTIISAQSKIIVERTMYWDSSGIISVGGHASQAIDTGASTWYLPEGFIGGANNFKTNILILNPTDIDVDVTVEFMVQGGGNVEQNYVAPARSRVTVGPPASLLGKSFSTRVSTLGPPIVVERTMYWDSNGITRVGGTASQGLILPQNTWYLPEGYIGGASNFKTNILVQNANGTDVNVTATYMVQGGGTVVMNHVVPALSRATIGPPASMLGQSFSTKITADAGILVERAMYWDSNGVGRKEGHAASGIPTLAYNHFLAEGFVGGPNNFKTNVLIQNPNDYEFTVYVAFYKVDGTYTAQAVSLPANSRVTVGPSVDLVGQYVSTQVMSLDNTKKFAVERTMYWDSGSYPRAGGTAASAIQYEY